MEHMIKVTPEQNLRILERNIAPMVKAIHECYEYDPGDSDLDDEQPISFTIRMKLGDYRRATGIHSQLRGI